MAKSETRFGSGRWGWGLARAAWRLLRGERALLQAAATLACTYLIASAAAWLFIANGGIGDRWTRVLITATLGAYLIRLLATFLGVTFAAIAAAALDGYSLKLRDGLTLARERAGAVALWPLLAMLFGIGLNALVSVAPRVLVLPGLVATVAWALATMFVQPAIALEQFGAVAALERSAELARRVWRGAVGGWLAIGAWTLVLLLGEFLALTFAIVLFRGQPALGIVALVLVGGAVLMTSMWAIGLAKAFDVVLFRGAEEGLRVGGLPTAQSRLPFARQRLRGAVGWAAAALIGLFLLAFVLGPHRHRSEDSAEVQASASTQVPASTRAPASVQAPAASPASRLWAFSIPPELRHLVGPGTQIRHHGVVAGEIVGIFGPPQRPRAKVAVLDRFQGAIARSDLRLRSRGAEAWLYTVPRRD